MGISFITYIQQSCRHGRGRSFYIVKLHCEVSCVVVFYRGNDGLDELEEDQEIPGRLQLKRHDGTD